MADGKAEPGAMPAVAGPSTASADDPKNSDTKTSDSKTPDTKNPDPGNSNITDPTIPEDHPQQDVPDSRMRKRIICCCDGTWLNGDGYTPPKIWLVQGASKPWSNITRISRSFKRHTQDGRHQIIFYQSGVGNATSSIESLLGGAFGMGVSERIREVYSFICANWVDGDEIVLIGFSRGAFTVRSVAGFIGSIGLLTREGMDMFYAIFTDTKNWHRESYQDPFPQVPFPNKPRGTGAAQQYARNLEELGLTRLFDRSYSSERPIPIKAIGVFDTVGSLGIPEIPLVKWLHLRSASFGQFFDTNLSPRVEHAFQALALDEDRSPYSPSVWELLPNPSERAPPTDLRQVWFPGTHGNVGGGQEDQGIADISLAWMMDQLASVGVEFDKPSLDRIYRQTADGYQTLGDSLSHWSPKWAADPIFDGNKPQRPWSLGAMRKGLGPLSWVMGTTGRVPGMYTKKEAESGNTVPLLDTNERIHSSVRVRTACKGLGLNDRGVWSNLAMTQNWRIKRVAGNNKNSASPPSSPTSTTSPKTPASPPEVASPPTSSDKWVWEYIGPPDQAPPVRVLPEEPMGPFERYYLGLAGGSPHVYDWAEQNVPSEWV